MKPTFHYLARAIIRDGEFVLLAHLHGADNTFLPGGHIESGEAARPALARELREELNVESEIGRFVGAVEHAWQDGQAQHCEINLVFEAHVSGLRATSQPVVGTDAEPGLEFRWVRVAELLANNLQPSPLIAWLQSMANGSQEVRPEEMPLWGSTIEELSE